MLLVILTCAVTRTRVRVIPIYARTHYPYTTRHIVVPSSEFDTRSRGEFSELANILYTHTQHVTHAHKHNIRVYVRRGVPL